MNCLQVFDEYMSKLGPTGKNSLYFNKHSVWCSNDSSGHLQGQHKIGSEDIEENSNYGLFICCFTGREVTSRHLWHLIQPKKVVE